MSHAPSHSDDLLRKRLLWVYRASLHLPRVGATGALPAGVSSLVVEDEEYAYWVLRRPTVDCCVAVRVSAGHGAESAAVIMDKVVSAFDSLGVGSGDKKGEAKE